MIVHLFIYTAHHDDQLRFPKVRLEIGRKGFAYYGPKLYNDLSNFI